MLRAIAAQIAALVWPKASGPCEGPHATRGPRMLTAIRLDNVRPWWMRYAAAVAITAGVILARSLWVPQGGANALLVFFPAAMLCLLVCGVGPGLLSLGATAALVYFGYFTPVATFAHHPVADLPVALYLIVGALLALVVGSLHSYADRLKAALQALSQTERRLHAIADHVPLGIVYFDRDDRVQFANLEFRRVNGRSEDPAGRPANDYLKPDIYAITAEALARALAGEPTRHTTRVMVDGQIRAREISYIPEVDDHGVVRGVYVLGYDVTEREQLGAQLRQAREDLEAILNNVPARITSWHADGTNRFANRAAEQALGLAPGQATGRPLCELIGSRGYEADRPLIDAALAGTSSTGEQQEELADGSVHYRQVTYVPSLREDRVIGLYKLETDITELRRSYERIRRLAQRVESIREEERRAVAKLLHEGLAQDLFATGMGLTHLEGLASSTPGLRGSWKELANGINRCIAATRQIANDLHPSALAHLRVSAALKDHARYFGELAGLSIEVLERAPFPVLDEGRRLILFRAAQEALTNVARHARARSVRIVLSASPTEVTMEVEDDGIGLGAGTHDKPGALGMLGMRERFAALGGEVVLHSREPNGARLSVRLPIEAGRQTGASLFDAPARRGKSSG